MKNKIKRFGIGIGAIVILLGTTRAFSEPGSELDPLVTLSYVEKKIEQLKNYIDIELGKKSTENENTAWVVVEVPAGNTLICKDGTEIILRSGEAKAVSKITKEIKNGVEQIIDNGLADVTAGKDLTMDENIIKNHLLIVPRDDGRGARALTNCFFIVKGDYEIK